MSSAGIFTNIIFAISFGIIWSVLYCFAPSVFLSESFFAVLLVCILEYGMLINLALAIFNLIPVPPLDGFRMLESAVGRRGYKFINFMERYSFVFMLVVIVFVMFVYNFVGEAAMQIRYGILWMFTKLFGLF